MEKHLDYGSYAGYLETVKNLNGTLKKLLRLSEEMSLENTAESIRETIKKAEENHFEVAIVGEFKRGKSTLINALLGMDVLPADVLPATAALNRVTYSEKPYIEVEYKDGKHETVDVDKLESYVTKLTSESAQKAKTIKEATVYYNTEFCRNNVDIIDTPGLNDDEQMTNLTLSILPNIDAAVFVISANSPFSQYEKDFLEKKMLSSDVERIIFVVNCFATFAKSEEDKIVGTVRDRITKYVMDKAKKVMGEDSREFEIYKRKIGTPRVIGVYAKRALTAKKINNQELLEESNFIEFENELEKLLTRERGVIELQVLANKITNSGDEILRSITMQQNAVIMANDEFLESYDKAIKEIDDIRSKKRQEFVKINEAAVRVFDDLKPVLDSYWTSVEQEAISVINNYPMTSSDFKKSRLKEVSSDLVEKIRAKIEERSQLICEQIQNMINIAVNEEAYRLQDFEDDFFESVMRIQKIFTISSKISKNGGTFDKGISAALGSFGVGGFFLGFREAGLKGALIGFGSGLAGFSVVFVPAFMALSPALPLTLGLMVLAGIAGTSTAGFTVNKLLINERVDRFKANLREQVKKQFYEMKLNNDFTETVRQQVFTAFEGLKAKIENETEIILRDTQKTLDDLNVLKAEKSEFSEKEQERLRNLSGAVRHIVSDAFILKKELSENMLNDQKNKNK